MVPLHSMLNGVMRTGEQACMLLKPRYCSLLVFMFTNVMLGMTPNASMACWALPATSAATDRSMRVGGMLSCR